MPSQDVCPSVCLSVCPSVTRRYYVKTVRHILKLFTPLGSHTVLVLAYQTIWQYPDRVPLTGASNARGYEKVAIFEQYLAVSPNNTR